MPDDTDDETLIRPAEAAALAGVDIRTLARWVEGGKLPARRTVGGQRRYRRADVLALVNTHA